MAIPMWSSILKICQARTGCIGCMHDGPGVRGRGTGRGGRCVPRMIPGWGTRGAGAGQRRLWCRAACVQTHATGDGRGLVRFQWRQQGAKQGKARRQASRSHLALVRGQVAGCSLDGGQHSVLPALHDMDGGQPAASPLATANVHGHPAARCLLARRSSATFGRMQVGSRGEGGRQQQCTHLEPHRGAALLDRLHGILDLEDAALRAPGRHILVILQGGGPARQRKQECRGWRRVAAGGGGGRPHQIRLSSATSGMTCTHGS